MRLALGRYKAICPESRSCLEPLAASLKPELWSDPQRVVEAVDQFFRLERFPEQANRAAGRRVSVDGEVGTCGDQHHRQIAGPPSEQPCKLKSAHARHVNVRD